MKMQLVLEAMVKAEGVEATDEDVEKVTAEEAERMGRDVEEFKKSLNDRQKQYLKENAEIRKVVDMIVASAQVEEKDESEKVNVQETLDAVAQAADAVTDADAKGEE